MLSIMNYQDFITIEPNNPVNKSKSVALTDEGKAKAEELFRKLFAMSKYSSKGPA